MSQSQSTARAVLGALRSRLSQVGLLTPLRRAKWELRVARRRRRQRARHPTQRVNQLPVLFANAMAKSGSHILSQYLEGLEHLTPLVFTDEHPVRTISRQGVHRDALAVMRDLRRLGAGDMAWGYVPHRPPYVDWFQSPDVTSYFIYRDPRDRIVSHVFYARDIHQGHAMREYYQQMDSLEACIEATIRGVPGLVQGIKAAYDSYLGWFELVSILKVRFEDLINDRERSLSRMLNHLEAAGVSLRLPRSESMAVLNEAMAPRHSPTFRSGTSGSWRDYFTEKNVNTFKQIAGNLLQILGYERDESWVL